MKDVCKLVVAAIIGCFFVAPAFAGGGVTGLQNAQNHVGANMTRNNNTHSRAPDVLNAVSTHNPGPGFGGIVSDAARGITPPSITTPITRPIGSPSD